MFTTDNATVYRISQSLLIPAITHQTPVKERHDILTRFRNGNYRTLVTSHVLNEGVDVPEAKVAIILSGTASQREFIQRLGRILRKGQDRHKLARLYEVVAEQTSEEAMSDRRQLDRRQTEAPTKPKLVNFPTVVQPSLPLYNQEYNEESDRPLPHAAESANPSYDL